jgi:hypothetical protein
MLEWLKTNWFSIVTFVSGIIVTKVFSNRKRLTYQIVNTEILTSKAAFPEGLSIKYHDVPVNGLNKTVYYVWNSGNITIKGNDIAKSDALRCNIRSSVCMIDVNSFQESKKACALQVAPEKNQDGNFVNISFDYLDKNDGFKFALIHNEESPPIIDGCISGTKIIKSKDTIIRSRSLKAVDYLFAVIILLMTGIPIYEILSNPQGILSYILIGILAALCITAFCATRTFRHKAPPKSITIKRV